MTAAEFNFQKIDQEYRPKIQRYLGRMVGEQEAEDLTQEVLLKVHRALGDYRGEAKLSTWLYRIATNAALDLLRSPAYRQEALSSQADRSLEQEGSDSQELVNWTGEKPLLPEQQVVRKEMNDCVREFIEQLPHNYRAVLLLSEVEGFKNDEIAEILDLSLGTVKIRLHRARQKLRHELEMHCESYWIEGNEYLPDLKRLFEQDPKQG